MDFDEQTLELIRSDVTKLPAEQRDMVYRVAAELRDQVRGCGEVGVIALALVGAEYAAGVHGG